MLAEASEHTIAIDADFSGKEILFFGATECPGDVVLVIRGPERRLIVSEKSRVAGIWINGEERVFDSAPAYYVVASTGPLETLLSAEMRAALGVGLDVLRLDRGDDRGLATEAYRAALVQERQARGLYAVEPALIQTVGEKLFRVSIWFPPNSPPGSYVADFYYVRDGTIVGSYALPLSVEKTGLEGLLHEFANDEPAAYGIAAIGLAVGGGWLVGALFRKG
jgi:uncharacterized protein (TIGR02186 family)